MAVHVDLVIIHPLSSLNFRNEVNKINYFSTEFNFLFLSSFLNPFHYFVTAQTEEQIQIESQQPKIYSKDLITNFLENRKLAKEQKEQRMLRKLFNYPDELLKIVDELPPSLRPIDPKELKIDFSPKFFG